MPNGPPSRSAPAIVSTENCPLVTAWPSRTNSGTPATMREIAATATFCATQAVETVAPDTGVGQRALQILASGTVIVTGLSTPSFQRMSGGGVGSSPVNNAPRKPERVQLMKPGACGEDSLISSVSVSPHLMAASSIW